MKKVFMSMAVVAAMVAFASCNNAPKAEEKAAEAPATETVADDCCCKDECCKEVCNDSTCVAPEVAPAEAPAE